MKVTNTIAIHCLAVWQAMYDQSTIEEDLRTYTGKLGELVKKLGISMTYYSPVFRVLYDGEYAALVVKGGRNRPSTVALIHEPTLNNLRDLTLTDPGPILSLKVRVDALEKSTGGMHIVGALQEIEKRLQMLEGSKGND